MRLVQQISPELTASWVAKRVFSAPMTKSTGPLIRSNGSPLRVVLYTRGNSGRGRSIGNEQLLVQALESRGALVLHCCDFGRVSLEEQLYIAVNADVVS
jgi:hypothetical protein